MPYELGLDMGCLEYGAEKLKTKKVLILETERYHYQKVISDIAGQDIENHDDDPKTLIRKVRDWFSLLSTRRSCPSFTEIWLAFNRFCSDLINDLTLRKGDAIDHVNKLPVSDFLKYARRWISSLNIN